MDGFFYGFRGCWNGDNDFLGNVEGRNVCCWFIWFNVKYEVEKFLVLMSFFIVFVLAIFVDLYGENFISLLNWMNFT